MYIIRLKIYNKLKSKNQSSGSLITFFKMKVLKVQISTSIVALLICCAAPPQDNITGYDTTAVISPAEPTSTDEQTTAQSNDEQSGGESTIAKFELDVEKRPAIPGDLTYEGQVTDEESGYSQFYTLKIRPDLSSASIGGGPYNTLQDQGGGVYMWLDGTIIGMSILPMRDKCVIYGSEGEYFCTLYRR